MNDLRREPLLRVETAVRVFQGTEDALDFAHGDGTVRLVRAQDVDRPALTELGERDLHLNVPAAPPEDTHASFDQLRVTLVEQTVGGCSIPPRDEFRAAAFGRHHFADAFESDVARF